MLFAVFVIGFMTGEAYGTSSITSEQPLSLGFLSGIAAEKNSPGDHVPEQNVHVFKDRVVIDIEDPFWATFTDTNSMDPVLDTDRKSVV